MGWNLLKLIIGGTTCGISPGPSATENPDFLPESVPQAEADGVFSGPSVAEDPDSIPESASPAEADGVSPGPSVAEDPDSIPESASPAEADGVFSNPSVAEDPDSIPESASPAEADGVSPGPSATENPDSIPESASPAEADSSNDENDKNSEIIELLTAKFRAQLGENSEIPDDLIKLFTDNFYMILHLETDVKMKCFATDQSIRYAIKNHDLPTLARILDNKIGNPVRKEIKASGMGVFKKAKRKYNVSTLENKCYTTIGRFFSTRQVLWIEYAIEMENLEAVALFFIYHWHSTYSDNNKETDKKLNEFADFAFQHNLSKIELFIRKLFDSEYSDDTAVIDIRKELKKYPIYGKNAAEAIRRNVQFAGEIINILTEDPTQCYIL
ncbi:MAG: hypothetical protein LBF34_04275 [Puniceicoccales bacterium]|nr:hypothetical protein [Puniceicoccales bacterium]